METQKAGSRRGLPLIAGMMLLAANQVAMAGLFEISWYSVDGGGGRSNGAAFELHGTSGQPDAGATMSGGNYAITGGFWAGSRLAEPSLPGDCNHDGFVDLVDFGQLSPCLLGPGGGLGTECTCFDLDLDADVDIFDAARFQAGFGGAG